MKIKINNEEIKIYLNIETAEFPKYATQILNLANQNAQATRPKVVGKMSDLIQKFSGKKISEWEKWYLKEKPEAINSATQKMIEMIENFKNVITKIDQTMIEKWVRDLVIVKTFIGLRCQEAILKKVAEAKKISYRLASFEDESKGIDGYLNDKPVSIKPTTYKVKPALQEKIKAKIIYYKKIKGGIEVKYD